MLTFMNKLNILEQAEIKLHINKEVNKTLEVIGQDIDTELHAILRNNRIGEERALKILGELTKVLANKK